MLKVILIRITLNRKSLGLTTGEVSKFQRQLYGYHSSSHYGRYHNWVSGLLDAVKGKKVGNGMLLVPENDFSRLRQFLDESKATVEIVTDKLHIEEEDFDKIETMGPDIRFQK